MQSRFSLRALAVALPLLLLSGQLSLSLAEAAPTHPHLASRGSRKTMMLLRLPMHAQASILSVTVSSTAYTAQEAFPIISLIGAKILGNTSVRINFMTNVPTDMRVEWGTSSMYGAKKTFTEPLTRMHSVDLTGLQPGMTYHYRVSVKDGAGNTFTSSDFRMQTTQ